jgi:hypothetical protein
LVLDDSDLGPLSRTEIVETMYVPEVVRGMVIGLSVISDGDHDVPGIRIEVMATDADSAVNRARNLLYQGRRAAKMRDAVLPIAWVRRLRDHDESNERFLDQAKDLLEGEKPELAVIAAHIYLEAHLKAQLEEVAAKTQNGTLKTQIEQERGISNLRSTRSRALIREHLGIDIAKSVHWQDFEASAVRRNAIVHDGEVVSEEDARTSLQTIRALGEELGTHR